MVNFKVKIAGHTVSVNSIYSSTVDHCQEYLTMEEAEQAFVISQSDIEYERMKSAREDALEGIPPREFSNNYLETIALQRKIAEELFRFDTLLFHGSVVAVDGEGYLFTAKSGTGKSTHTRLWREVFGDRAVMVNDDKPFLKIGENVTAYGSPWNGKHGLGTNTAVPLKAICILERGEENVIEEIPAQECLTMLFQQSNRPRSPRWMPQYMDLIDRLAGKVRFYRLKCNMDPQAAKVAYEGMQ